MSFNASLHRVLQAAASALFRPASSSAAWYDPPHRFFGSPDEPVLVEMVEEDIQVEFPPQQLEVDDWGLATAHDTEGNKWRVHLTMPRPIQSADLTA